MCKKDIQVLNKQKIRHEPFIADFSNSTTKPTKKTNAG
jgi:hypothetical protein